MRICTIEGCGRDHSGHGLCAMHLKRFKRWGTAADPPSYDEIVCICVVPTDLSNPVHGWNDHECGTCHRLRLDLIGAPE